MTLIFYNKTAIISLKKNGTICHASEQIVPQSAPRLLPKTSTSDNLLRHCTKTSSRDILQRHPLETSFRDICQKHNPFLNKHARTITANTFSITDL